MKVGLVVSTTLEVCLQFDRLGALCMLLKLLKSCWAFLIRSTTKLESGQTIGVGKGVFLQRGLFRKVHFREILGNQSFE